MQKELELYLHIPFCVRKCRYCDFLSFAKDEEVQNAYVQALCEEIKGWDGFENRPISTIFIGGGTPTILPARKISRILETIQEKRDQGFPAPKEITIECNPGTVDEADLQTFLSSGINRISFGLQSADNRELETLGRIHSWEEFLESYRLARKAGFENINVDLMSALPGQTPAGWRRTLEKVLALQPEHISAYSLIIEEETPFYQIYGEADRCRREDEPQSLLPSEEEEREMYEDTERILAAHGYHRYEISNYAKGGKECRHNCGYWTGIEYKGFGLGASSLLQKRRYRNTESLESYLDGAWQPEMVEALTRENEMEETVILGLRMMEGVSGEKFYQKYGKHLADIYGETIRKYVKMGLMEAYKQGIRLTESGISVSNAILSDFLISE